MKKADKLVSSNIEITKSTSKKDGQSRSLKEYHANIRRMSRDIVKFAISLEPENLLSVKMAIMDAMREVEKKMKGNQE